MKIYIVKYLFSFLVGVISGYLLSIIISPSINDVEALNEKLTIARANLPLSENTKTQPITTRSHDSLSVEEAILNKEKNTSTSLTNDKADKELSEEIVKLEAENQKLKRQYQRVNEWRCQQY